MANITDLQQILAEKLGVNSGTIPLNAYLVDTLGANDTSLGELKSALEDTFGITIPDEDFSQLLTVRNLIDYIETHAGL